MTITHRWAWRSVQLLRDDRQAFVDGYTIREADSDSELVTRTGTLSKACATGLTVDPDGSLLIAGPDGIARSQHR